MCRSRACNGQHGRVATDASSLYAVGGRVREYSYDAAGRLTEVADTREGACSMREYGFDVNGNRTSSAAYAPAADGSCQTATASSTAATAFTAADQPTGAGLAYDALGRTTSLPAAHTATPAAGPVALAYYASGLLRSATTGAQMSAWTLDGSDRLACRRDKPAATVDSSGCGATTTSGVVDTVNHYAGGGDAPAWTVTRTGGTTPTTTTTRYLPGLDGGMLATVTGGTAVIALADLHGDTPLTATTSQAVAPDGATTDTDEYGQVRDAAGAPTTGPRYAWLGTSQRDATAGSGLTLMGVRVYNPATGRFLTTDPVRGGNTTTYAYPTDPVGAFDFFGYCEDRTARCVIAVLTTREPFPRGFIRWLARRGAGVYSATSGSRIRYAELGGDHCSHAPNTYLYFDFTVACDTHDLGYDLLRFFRIGGGARAAVDRLFGSDMRYDCSTRSWLFKGNCYVAAGIYSVGVRANSAREGYGVPG